MKNSTLVQLIQSFSPAELRDLRKFLDSPFFNLRKDVALLFEYLIDCPDYSKEQAWKAVYGAETALEDQKIRLLMSYLHGLLEQYLSVKEAISDPISLQSMRVTAYRKRRMPEAFERSTKQLSKNLEEQPQRNVRYHEHQFALNWEMHQVIYPQKPTDVSHLLHASESLDIAYWTKKLQAICLLAAHQSVYKSGLDQQPNEAVVALAEQSEYAQLPAIAVYLHCYKMLQNPKQEIHFQHFKQKIVAQGDYFSSEELHGLFILAINYCVRRLNAGEAQYYSEALDLYKEGLAKEHIFEEGNLSRFTYHNIVAIALHVGDLEWARFFIHQYKARLERKYREPLFSFNLARLAYTENNHAQVLELLQKANYRDPLHNLAAKTLLLKTYVDLGEIDSLQSHLDAMRNYIQRKRVLGYHRANYLNLIRYAEKMLRLPPKDRNAARMLLKAVENEENLSEKSFFLRVLAGYIGD